MLNSVLARDIDPQVNVFMVLSSRVDLRVTLDDVKRGLSHNFVK